MVCADPVERLERVDCGKLLTMVGWSKLSSGPFTVPPDDDGGSGDATLDALTENIRNEGFDWWTVGTAIAIFVVAILLSRFAKSGLERILRRRIDPALATLIARLVGYLIVVIGVVYSLDSLGVAIVPILGALGIAGIALAFAFQDILENFVAGVLLQLQRPFTYGDQVKINEHEGTVDAIDSRIVTIITPVGETIKIPSATVIKSDINNYTQQGARRTSLPIGVAYGSDLESAERVLTAAVKGAEGVMEFPSPEVYLTGFGDSSIDFDIRFWHEPSIATYWKTRHAVARRVERALADEGITIPFPQRTLWWAGDSDD